MQVELHHGFHWVCPYCGTENWQLSVPYSPAHDLASLDEEGEAELKDVLGLEPWQELPEEELQGAFYTAPDHVICKRCDSTYIGVEPEE